MSEIKVYVFRRKGRKNFEAEFRDPRTGRKTTRSLKTPLKREADRKAGQLEKELREGQWKATRNVGWKDFRERYESEVASGLALRTADKIRTVFNSIEDLIGPATLQALDSGAISQYQVKLRTPVQKKVAKTKEVRTVTRSKATISGYLAHLKASLNWAKDQDLLLEVPRIRMPEGASKGRMKGRPITTEEFERMLANTEKEVGEDQAKSWKFFLRGLWWSGLRIGEAIRLSWTDDRELMVDLSGKRPMFRIHAEAEKGRKDRILPMAPEFAQLLEQVPEDQREGFVFDTVLSRNTGKRRTDTATKTISAIGKAANVKTGPDKTATAHDLRRAFGLRWSQRVMPPILQLMMRHENISTTQRFYVGRDAQAAAEAIWSAFSDIPSDTPPSAVTDTL